MLGRSPLSRVRRSKRVATVCALALAAVLALGARCIDRTHTYVDSDGYTHITGEMVNDTSVQGVQVMLRGTLFDAQGRVVAQKDAPTCPPDTQPNQQTVFDIRFDNPNVPPWTTFDVRTISGKALPAPLPSPQVVLFFADAARFVGLPPLPGVGITDKDVILAFNVRNQSAQTYDGIQGCAAVYNQAGNVTFVTSSEIVQRDASGNVGPAVLGNAGPGTVFMIAKNVPPGPIQVRAWLWFGPKGAPTSQYQFVATNLITIQTITGP